jgi:hypothetical protein
MSDNTNVSSASSNTTQPSMIDSVTKMFNMVTGGKSKKNRKSRGGNKKGKRSSVKKRRGGSCAGSTGAHGAQVAGPPGSQVTVPGEGNMMSYSTPSTLTPLVVSGGKKNKKRKGGNLTEMAVPVVLVLGNKYGQYLSEKVKSGVSTVKGVIKMPGNFIGKTLKSMKK